MTEVARVAGVAARAVGVVDVGAVANPLAVKPTVRPWS